MKPDLEPKKMDDSIRVTLRISKECADSIEWLAARSRTTQKQLFDSVSQFLLAFGKSDTETILSFFDQIAAIQKTEARGIRKAQVVSRSAYRIMGSFSKRHGISRDSLVEGVIGILGGVEKSAAEKNEGSHREAKQIVDDLWDRAEESEKQLKRIVGDDDPIVNRLGMAIVVLMNLSQDIASELETGIPIDPEGL
jgi:hypothetical protein